MRRRAGVATSGESWFSNEEWALKRELSDEARDKFYAQIPVAVDSASPLFVHEWLDAKDGRGLVAFGCDDQARPFYLPLKLKPSLFALSREPQVAEVVGRLLGARVTVYRDLTMIGNNYSLFDLLADYERRVNETSCLIRFECDSLAQVRQLFGRFSRDANAYKYAAVPLYWSNVVQILFELYLRHGLAGVSFPHTHAWYDRDLNYFPRLPDPRLAMIAFDIETVSTDANRVPTGESADDELFSVSVHHVPDDTLYTLVYVPIGSEPAETVRRRILEDGYPEYPELAGNSLEVFSTEVDLLRRTMELLWSPRLHFLVGYNSLNYDVKYLLTRCAFYNLNATVDRFVYRDGYAYGWSQIHVDLFRVIRMRNKFRSYTLNNVAKELLKETKTGVSAVALRFTFHAHRTADRYFVHAESTKWPSVRDTLHYNNQDTVLVTKLVQKTNALEFAVQEVRDCGIPFASLMSNFDKMRYKLWSRCFVRALRMNAYFATFKSRVAHARCPLDAAGSDKVLLTLDLDSQLNEDEASPFKRQLDDVLLEKRKKYPGGANFCLGKYDENDVTVLDYRIAYPLLIERKNISDETATIMPANVFLAHVRAMTPEQVEKFETSDYMSHSGSNKTETEILYYQYIYEGRFCGERFLPTVEELSKRKTRPIIVIWHGKRGLLSLLITEFNEERERVKKIRNILKSVADCIEERLSASVALKYDLLAAAATASTAPDATNEESSTVDDGDGDFGFDEDDDDDDDRKKSERNDDESGDFGFDENSEKNDDDEDGDFGFDENSEKNDDASGDFGFDDNDEDCDEKKSERNSGDFGFDGETVDGTAETQRGRKRKLSQVEDSFPNPFGLASVCRFVWVNDNGSCEIDVDALERSGDIDRQCETLREIQAKVSIEEQLYADRYNLMKALISSIYGCVGTLSSCLAAVITANGRLSIISKSRYLREKMSYEILYMDTDSIHVKHRDPDIDKIDPSPMLNRLFPYTEIEKTLVSRSIMIKTKIHLDVVDGSIKYGQHVNGPPAWRKFVNFVFRQTDTRNNEDIASLFRRFFEETYDDLLSHREIDDDFLAKFTQTVKVQKHYVTATPVAKYKDWVLRNYPTIANALKHSVYAIVGGDVTEVQWRPACHFKDLADLRTVNLFKYYQHNFSTAFYLIEAHVRRNNAPYNVTLSPKPVLLAMIDAFLVVRESRFPRLFDSVRVPVVDDLPYNEQADER